MRVCFLTFALPAPPAIAEYARRLDAVVAQAAPEGSSFDVAVATDWASTAHLFEVRAKRHAFWVDHFAHRRMGTWQAERFAAQLAYDLPVDFIAAAPWVRDTLADLRPEARCELVTAGRPQAEAPATPPPAHEGVRPLESTRLKGSDPGPAAAAGGGAGAAAGGGAGAAAGGAESSGGAPPLRVHLAGGGDERAALDAMEEPAVEVGLADAPDVVVMLSAVDGVLGAPLEGFGAGATAVVGPAHDAQDLVRHGENGFVADADDVRGAARWLDHLARDRDLLARLREAARATAAAWPTWEQSAAEMEAALARLVAEDPPPQAAWPVRLMGDAIGGAAVFRQEIATLTTEVHRLQGDDAYRVAVQVRERWRTARLGPLRRLLAAAARRAKSRAAG